MVEGVQQAIKGCLLLVASGQAGLVRLLASGLSFLSYGEYRSPQSGIEPQNTEKVGEQELS
ncbi:hypothetical protein L484_018457 [Morus notabilis]|uniref:Uncharacterized protein n=1 Tax=Morus notabilis TaxID=981085 RepID=W9QD93_9ROSA|nr:hypothetical protein L484_018457 [Morus notabilis]